MHWAYNNADNRFLENSSDGGTVAVISVSHVSFPGWKCIFRFIFKYNSSACIVIVVISYNTGISKSTFILRSWLLTTTLGRLIFSDNTLTRSSSTFWCHNFGILNAKYTLCYCGPTLYALYTANCIHVI